MKNTANVFLQAYTCLFPPKFAIGLSYIYKHSEENAFLKRNILAQMQ